MVFILYEPSGLWGHCRLLCLARASIFYIRFCFPEFQKELPESDFGADKPSRWHEATFIVCRACPPPPTYSIYTVQVGVSLLRPPSLAGLQWGSCHGKDHPGAAPDEMCGSFEG
jgi:hypothetical protein